MLGLLLATAFGAWVRTLGLDVLLPCMLEPDAVYVGKALELRDRRMGSIEAQGELPEYYPRLLPWTLSWLPLAPQAPAADAPLAEHLAAAGAPWLWGRRLVALISIGIVPATYLLARALLSRGSALLAASFAAASLVHLVFSQQARPHGAFVVLSTLALVAVLHLVRSGTRAAHALAGCACALAITCLHSGVFLLPALAAGVALARARGATRLLLAFAPIALSLRVGYPGLWGSTHLEGAGMLTFSGHALSLELFGGHGFVLGPQLFASVEPVLALLLVIALCTAAARITRRRDLVVAEKRGGLSVLAAFGVPFAAVIGAFDRPWDKYWLPLLPLACLFAAAAAERGASSLRLSRAARLAGALALLALPAWACARHALLRLRPDSAQRTAAWIEDHLERSADRIVTGAWLSLPLLGRPPEPDPMPDWALTPWGRYQRRHPELAARGDAWDLWNLYVPSQDEMPGRAVLERDVMIESLRASGAGWIVLERYANWEDSYDETHGAVLAVGGQLAASFVPYDPQRVTLDSRAILIGDQTLLRALTLHHLGSHLEVWRLPPSGADGSEPSSSREGPRLQRR